MRRPQRLSFAAAAALSLALSRPAHATEAAPLPPKDIRWSATLGGVTDVGSLPRAAAGLALGFDVRRGALAARGVTSVFAPQTDRTTGATIAYFDVMAMVCALAPIGSRFDLGACGGGGAGLFHASQPAGDPTRSGVTLRPEGLATTRFDMALSSSFYVSLEVGTVLDPLRTRFPLAAPGDDGRASLFAFRAALSLYLRVW